MGKWQIIFSKGGHQVPFLRCDLDIPSIEWRNEVLSHEPLTNKVWRTCDTVRLPRLVYKNDIYFHLDLLRYLLLEPSHPTVRKSTCGETTCRCPSWQLQLGSRPTTNINHQSYAQGNLQLIPVPTTAWQLPYETPCHDEASQCSDPWEIMRKCLWLFSEANLLHSHG